MVPLRLRGRSGAVDRGDLRSVVFCCSAGAVLDVDRAREQLILETLLPTLEPAGESAEIGTIREIERELSGRLDEEIDLDSIAARHGLSPATFRRRWAQVNHTPPARYRLQLRLRESCRLLTETNRPIFEIARLVGFADEFNFSRRFHRGLKVVPRTYWRMSQVHRANGPA